MQAADELVRDIVKASQIPSERQRQAVARELRSHVEDSILAAREAGHSDDEVRRFVLATFGDPGQVAQGFAWVYRRERSMLRIAVFVLSTLAVAGMLAAAILGMQAGMAFGFGSSVVKVVASRHTVIEAQDIFSTVAAYLGFISLEKVFDRHRLRKSLAVLALAFAVTSATCAAAHIHAPFLAFGFVSGVFLRSIRAAVRSTFLRSGFAVACFAAAGFSFQSHTSALQYAFSVNCASWLVMGAGYQLMAGLAPRVDEALSNGLQRF